MPAKTPRMGVVWRNCNTSDGLAAVRRAFRCWPNQPCCTVATVCRKADITSLFVPLSLGVSTMNFQRKKVATALAFIAGSGALAASTAYGQTSSPDIRVEVTGSNIKRVQGEGALPVTVLTREDINKTGTTNAYDLLQYISANNSAGNVSFGNVIGATTFSAQTASLRAAPRAPLASAGPERAAWDSVFAPELLDRFAARLADLPVARRQAVRSALYADILALLPPGFPAVQPDDAARDAARAKLAAGGG